MKTIVAIFALFPLIVFGGINTGPSTVTPAQLAAARVVTNGATWQVLYPSGGDDALMVSNAAVTYSNIWLMAGTFNASNTVVVPANTTIRGSGKDSTFWNPCQTNYVLFGTTNGVRVSFFPGTNMVLTDFTILTGPSNPNGNLSTPVGSYSSTYTNLKASLITRNMRLGANYDGIYWRYTKATNSWIDFNSEIDFRWDFAVMGATANSFVTNFNTRYYNSGVLSNPSRCVWMQGGFADLQNCSFDYANNLGGNYAVYFDDTFFGTSTFARLKNCYVGDATIYGAGFPNSYVVNSGSAFSNSVAMDASLGGNQVVVEADWLLPNTAVQDAGTPTIVLGSTHDGLYSYTNSIGQNFDLGNGAFSQKGIAGITQNISIQTNAGHGYILKYSGGIVTNSSTY